MTKEPIGFVLVRPDNSIDDAVSDCFLRNHGEGDLVRMNILVNADPADALSMLVHRDRA